VGERVIYLTHIDVRRRDAGPSEGLATRDHAGRLSESSHSLIVVCEIASPVPSTRRDFGAVAGPFLTGEDDRSAAVGANAAVQLGERSAIIVEDCTSSMVMRSR